MKPGINRFKSYCKKVVEVYGIAYGAIVALCVVTTVVIHNAKTSKKAGLLYKLCLLLLVLYSLATLAILAYMIHGEPYKPIEDLKTQCCDEGWSFKETKHWKVDFMAALVFAIFGVGITLFACYAGTLTPVEAKSNEPDRRMVLMNTALASVITMVLAVGSHNTAANEDDILLVTRHAYTGPDGGQ